jgi:hypothetical protein
MYYPLYVRKLLICSNCYVVRWIVRCLNSGLCNMESCNYIHIRTSLKMNPVQGISLTVSSPAASCCLSKEICTEKNIWNQFDQIDFESQWGILFSKKSFYCKSQFQFREKYTAELKLNDGQALYLMGLVRPRVTASSWSLVLSREILPIWTTVACFFLVQHTKTGVNI